MNKTTAYIGPTIAHVVREGTVFRNGYPPKLTQEIERTPFLTGLFVPLEEIAKARKTARTPESDLNMLYRRAEKAGGKENNGI